MLIFIFMPLISSLCCSFGGSYLGERGSMLLSTFIIWYSFFCALAIFFIFGVNLGSNNYITLFPWFELGLFTVNWCFCLDSISMVMSVVVLGVSALVHTYSCGYMEGDPHIPRFMSYLSLFTFFMLILITSDNFLQLFLGWEGVGLCSYLLVGFWFTRTQAVKSAFKAIIVNKVGDLGLLLGILFLYYCLGSVEFSLIFCLTPYISLSYIKFGSVFSLYILDTICLFLFIGSIGKSAQLGLHMWLPAAMEGPTPVSALIHAATMVTAGVFLIIKCSPIFEYAPFSLVVVTIMGASTSIFASTVGICQSDIKRVIAYSTCSQLGYMVFACGLSGYDVSLFHLMNHAFFKALLFLSAGSVIHGLNNEQDMRNMGGLVKLLPFTYSMMVIGSLSLSGFPYLSGFYSKDVCLEFTSVRYEVDSILSFLLAISAALFTSFYSFRLLYLTFWVRTNVSKTVLFKIHEPTYLMLIPLFILSFFSIFSGYLLKDMFIGLGSNFWNNAIYVSNKSRLVSECEFLPNYIKFFPLIFSFVGMSLIYPLSFTTSLGLFKTRLFYILYSFLSNKWFFDRFFNYYLNKFILKWALLFFLKEIDKGLVELLGPKGLVYISYSLTKELKQKYFGRFFIYVLFILLSILFLLGFLYLHVKFI